jgi:anti-anti-sigma regulatory factor
VTLAVHARDTRVAGPQFGVSTVHCDATRAALRVSGHLEVGTAPILSTVADGHVRAGRRYLRVDVADLTSVDDAALEVISEIHRQLLACRGTLIFTGVTCELEKAFAQASANLFLLAATAADSIDTPKSVR